MYPSKNFPFLGGFIKNIEKNIENNQLDKVVINKKSKNLISKFFTYLTFYSKVVYKLAFGKYDFVYIHFISHTALPVLLMSKFIKFDIISHVHGGDIKNLGSNKLFFQIKKYISQLAIDNSRSIIFPSKSYFDFAKSQYVISEEKKIVIYPSGGVSKLFFNDISIRENNITRIGYAGRLIKSKNIEKVIESLCFMPNITLDIVGEGILYNYLKQIVKDNELEKRVKFIEGMSQEDLNNWFKTIDYLVYPSSSESLGLVPLEAIACGVIPILSNIPAFNEFIQNGIDCYILNDITGKSISEGIFYFINLSPKDRIEIIKKNRISCYDNYSSEVTRRQLNEIFK